MGVKRERRLGVFENRLLKGIFGPKKDEIVGGWGILRNRSFITCTRQISLE
jgi:hypothetical protein